MEKEVYKENREVAVELLKRYGHCHEETLELTDFFTASTTKLQVTNAYYMEAFCVLADDPKNLDSLKMWIALKPKNLDM
jgi:predicted oxidoreductase (fatty acid repression mutant protein)